MIVLMWYHSDRNLPGLRTPISSNPGTTTVPWVLCMLNRFDESEWHVSLPESGSWWLSYPVLRLPWISEITTQLSASKHLFLYTKTKDQSRIYFTVIMDGALTLWTPTNPGRRQLEQGSFAFGSESPIEQRWNRTLMRYTYNKKKKSEYWWIPHWYLHKTVRPYIH